MHLSQIKFSSTLRYQEFLHSESSQSPSWNGRHVMGPSSSLSVFLAHSAFYHSASLLFVLPTYQVRPCLKPPRLFPPDLQFLFPAFVKLSNYWCIPRACDSMWHVLGPQIDAEWNSLRTRCPYGLKDLWYSLHVSWGCHEQKSMVLFQSPQSPRL